MQIASDVYKAYMSRPVRPPFHMEITVHTDTPIVYTDNEIFEFEEKKTAHPIGAELPTIEVSFKVDNIAGDYNADSPSGLYEQLIKGVKVTYKYGLEIPNVMPYGYPADEGETEEPIYGADPLNPYGFSPSSTIEWMDGGEVYTTGEISYDKTSAAIEAVDALSFLEDTAGVAYGTITRKQCAEFIIGATEYPEDASGAKKISIDNVLETWNTNLVSDKNAKQVLQSLAHASGVQIYIDRSGYLHLDKIPITTGAVDYHVTLGDQGEDGEFTKGKTPRKVVVKVNTKNVVPEVSETINPRGEDILVENDFVQTTLQAEVVLPWVKRYLGMRNTAEIEYAGDPALDILDIILLDTEYSENIPATIVESTIRFDGSITGSLVLRYDSALADNTTVKITGAENFMYTGETPSPASVTLVCETDMASPSYEWSYFNNSSSGWQVISGATTANLTILADSAYIIGSNPTSFRVVVTGDEGTKGTTVRIQRVQEAVAQGHTYLGKLTALPSAYDVGDYFLVSTAFSGYGLGDVVQWDGDSWEVTTNPTLIVSVYQDALTLSMPLENTSAVNQYIRSIQTKQILLSTDTPIMFFYEDDTPYDGGQVATITATRRNVISGINWYINGDLVPDYDEDTIMVCDTDMSGNEITVTAVSVEYASVNAVIKIAKKKDRKLDANNLGLVTDGDPTPTEGKDGAELVAGDYFMWGNPTTSTPDERKKGAVYIYQTNGTWLEDTEGTKTMSMFAQFAELPNDTDSSVMGNLVVKKLVAINAFIENLKARMLEVVDGTYSFKANNIDGLLLENGMEVLLHAPPSGGLFIGGAVNTSGVVSGEIDITDDSTVLLKTQRETTSGTTSSSPSGSLYSVDELKSGGAVEQSSVPAAASGTFGGKTISKACFRASAGKVQLGSMASGVVSSAGYNYPTYNVWQSGALGANLGAQKIQVAVSYDDYTSCYFKKNGVQQQMVGVGPKYFTFDYNADDYYEVGVRKFKDEYEEYQYDRAVYEVAAVIEGTAFWEEVSRSTTTWQTTYRETKELPDDAPLGTRKTVYYLIEQRTSWDFYDRFVSITLTFESTSSYPAGFVFINSDTSYTTLPYTAGYIDHDTHPITLNSWDSSSNKPYISGSDFVSAFSAFPSGVASPVSPASSNLTSFYPVGESSNPLSSVAYVNYNTSYVSFIAAGGMRIIYNFGGNGSSVGVYNSLAALVEKVTLPRGVIVDSLIRSNENSAIGADNAPFLAAYAQTFHGDVNAPGTSKNVWGAVFN